MDSLFGIPLTSIMISLLVLMTAAFAIIGWIVWRNPLLVRMGLRNVARRKAQTTLIAVGLMLSTLIISAAFATGDTVGFSITNELYRQMEEVDFVIASDTEAFSGPSVRDETLRQEFLAALQDEFDDDEQIDGITGIVVETLPVVNLERRLSEPEATVVGVDPATVDSFRALRALDGRPIAAATLGGNSTYITERLADAVAAGPGDTLTVFFDNEPHQFKVIDVVRDTSVTGAAAEELTTGGIVVHIETLRQLTHTSGYSYIAVSARGGTRDSVALSDSTIEERIEAFIDSHPEANAHILFTKEEFIAIGELIGSVFVTFFLIMGLFSIAAGIMLIFLIFIMLAAERRPEMGMARAVGMNRLHLTESFLAEGMAYNVGSAAVGALAGLAVAALLIFVLGRIFADFGLDIVFHFNPQAFVIAYSLGVVLTFATVIFSAYRAANLNIVRAIRDLPEPQPLRGEDRSIVALAKSAAGVLWYLVWLLIIAIFIGVGVTLFIFTLGTYGIGLLPAGLLAAWFIFGARRARGQRLSRPGAGSVATLLLWVLLPIVPLALAAWRAIRGDRARARRVLSTLLYAYWWIAFTAGALMAPITWLLLRTKAWADRHRNAGGWAVWMIALGLVLIYFGGWQTSFLFAYTGGTTLAVLAIAMLAVYFGSGARTAFTVAGLALVWYWLLPLPFSLLFEGGEDFRDPIDGVLRFVGLDPDPGDGNIEMFFVSGISITAAATLVVIFNADAILGLVRALGGLLGGIAPAIKTAVAYPLAAKFRTAMTLAMFGLVVFSLVVMATLNFNFTQLLLGEEASAGFDVGVEANPSNRIPDLRAALAEERYDVDANISGVGTLVSAFPEMRMGGGSSEFHRYRLQGADDEFLRLARLPMQFRAIGYDSDEAVIQALRTDTTVAVVDASRFPQEGPFGEPERGDIELPVTADELREAPWEPIPITLRTPGSSEELTLKIIAVIEPQATFLDQFFAVFTARENVERHFGGGRVEDFFVTTVRGSDEAADTVAKGIESALLARGVQAESIPALIDDAAGASTAFQLLFEGFMSLGLVVGIAALGVIAFRTVVERRQQIGMLRAIGYTRRLIALSFFFESSFIALTGIVMGLVLGAALSYNLLTSPEFTEGAEINFQLPWLRLAIIGGVAYGASALMTLIPARSASRVAVAEALRYE